jgi:hypothetical protein
MFCAALVPSAFLREDTDRILGVVERLNLEALPWVGLIILGVWLGLSKNHRRRT